MICCRQPALAGGLDSVSSGPFQPLQFSDSPCLVCFGGVNGAEATECDSDGPVPKLPAQSWSSLLLLGG